MADVRYIFGNEVPIEVFVMMQKFWCGNYVELQYYTYLGSATNGGVITEDVCAISFAHDEIVSRDEIMKMRDVGGKIRFKYAGFF